MSPLAERIARCRAMSSSEIDDEILRHLTTEPVGIRALRKAVPIDPRELGSRIEKLARLGRVRVIRAGLGFTRGGERQIALPEGSP